MSLIGDMAPSKSSSSPRDSMLLLGAADREVGDLVPSRIPGPIGRAKDLLGDRQWDLGWFERVAARSTSGESRILLRVDEFPYSSSFDQPERHGVERATLFHQVLADAGVPYLMSIVPQLTHAVLDPRARGGRAIGPAEIALIDRMREDGVTFAQHGTTHRTRHRSPRRRSEFTGLSRRELGELLDRGAARLADAGVEPRILVPPYNRFSAAQLPVFAERFDVVTGGPETIRFMGNQYGPTWQGEIVYLPSMVPLYGVATEVLPALRRLESATGAWIPVTLHVAWELDDDLVGLRALADHLAGRAVSWEDLLEAVDESRDITS